MADEFNGDFARLVPKNHFARQLFNATYVYVTEKNTFHLQFLDRDCEGAGDTLTPDECFESSTDYDDDVDDASRGAPNPDHFLLSFDPKRKPEMPHLGWRAGKGTSKSLSNLGVDLLLAKPGQGKGLASVHLIFAFHLTSGFLMLQGGSSRLPVEYKVHNEWERLHLNERYVLYRPSTRIRCGKYEYDLEFVVKKKHQEAYCLARNNFLRVLSPGASFDHAADKIPGADSIVRGRYIELKTEGVGAFGWVTSGVDIGTGDLVGVKEFRIHSKHDGEKAMAEVRLGVGNVNKIGLMPTIGAICEHGKAHVCCKPEKFFMFMPFGISDFSKNDFWTNPALPRTTKLSLLHEPLEGIQILHHQGIMHRDIRRQNTMIISLSPPQAVLIDFGKATYSQTSSSAQIGPTYTLAPEVWEADRGGRPYTSKIDIWAYGLLVAEVLGYRQKDNREITTRQHDIIMKVLQYRCDRFDEDRPIAQLAMECLDWSPELRPTAEMALAHPCWNVVPRRLEDPKKHLGETGESSGAKRPQLDASKSK